MEIKPQPKPQGKEATGAVPHDPAAVGDDKRTGDKRVELETRRPQFMISPRQAPGLQPLSADFVAQQLKDNPEITVVKTIEPPRLLGLESVDGGGLGSLVIARMSPDKAQLLQTQASGRLVVERDPPLTFVDQPMPPEARLPNLGVLVPHANGFKVTFEVRGEDGALPGATVYVFGSVWPTQGVTDNTGHITINVTGESPDTIRALYVNPRANHWSLWVDRPQLVPDTVTTIQLTPLGKSLQGFPGRQLLGWGQKAMGLDAVPPSFDGAGVKIAVIDSGAAKQTHRNLHKVGPGVSIVGDKPDAWTVDTIGHGSHCAGIIGGGPLGDGPGIRGFAPAAEIHVCRIFPGGRFSDLVSALDYCMEKGIDVVNMSLGGGEPSRIIEERIVKAKAMGVACVVAAGNSGGPVQFPASTPHVLAVAAMGKWGEFPGDSYHARQVVAGFERRDGYFPASFCCFGPEIDVCAPGVAIVSSLPSDDFGAWDGTSMAAPHVTGLAALVLAHHPDFKGEYQARDARRVERLFQIVKESSAPLQFGDPSRVGAGLPNAPRALRLGDTVTAGITSGLSTGGSTLPDTSIEALKQLLGLLVRASARGEPVAASSGATGTTPPFAPDPRRSASGAASTGATVARGPAYTGGLGGDPSPDELRNAMRRAGLLS
jgi:subtilisin family serine protease